MKKIYFIQQKKYYGYDPVDNENIEECMIIGYFTSLKLVDTVKDICKKNGIDEKNIDVQNYEILIRNNQKFIYVLSHSYSIKEDDDTYTDYEYIFEPRSNRKQCIELKKELKLNPKYKFNIKRIYDDNSLDGFFLGRYKLNCIYFPIYMNLEDS